MGVLGFVLDADLPSPPPGVYTRLSPSPLTLALSAASQ